MCIGKNNVYVIGTMIHKFCYSHLIMINTLYTCTVQVRVLYTVQYRVYYYFWARFNIIGGGGACTLYSTECIIIFARLILFVGGLSPQALMTRRPWRTTTRKQTCLRTNCREQTAYSHRLVYSYKYSIVLY